MSQLLFFVVILLSNIIQGITGFAGTILAMPPSLMLVGYEVAKPILNVLGLLAGVAVFLSHGKHVNWNEMRKVIVFMTYGIIAGILLKTLFIGQEKTLYRCLGVFVIIIAAEGYRRSCVAGDEPVTEWKSRGLLLAAGIAHGMFVSGGPLLIGYLSKVIKDKLSFRATISTVWIVLNTIIFLDDMRLGLWTPALVRMQVISIPFMAVGMMIGTWLYMRMSQTIFMKLTYILLVFSGITLLIR